MANTFVVRGDKVAAFRALEDSSFTPLRIATPPTIVADASPGVIGGSYIKLDNDIGLSVAGGMYRGQLNTPTGKPISVLLRFSFPQSPAGSTGLFYMSGGGRLAFNLFEVRFLSSNNFNFFMKSFTGSNGLGGGGSNLSFTPVINTWYDLLWTWSGNAADDMTVHVDNVLLGNPNPTQNFSATKETGLITEIGIGMGQNLASTRMWINEFLIADTIIDPNNVTFDDDTTGTLNGDTRSKFVKASALNAAAFTVPVAADVRDGVALVDAGVADVGVLESIEVTTDALDVSLAGGPLTAEIGCL